MVIYTSSVVNYIYAYFNWLKHAIINLVMIRHILINNRVKMSILAHKLFNKSLINVVVVNRKTWSEYHYILDYVISLLILTCVNLIGWTLRQLINP